MSDTFRDRPEAYLPGDRRRALAEGRSMPDRVVGSALFADISGFTPLTEALANELGPQRGAEELTTHLDRVFHAIIDQVDRYAGHVISFAGDAITCWLDGDDGRRAAACGLAIQQTMASIGLVRTPAGREVVLGIKVAIAVGPARRFVVGDPAIQLIDVLAGRLVDELADAEHLAVKGDVVLAPSAMTSLGDLVVLSEMRTDQELSNSVGVVTDLSVVVADVATADSGAPLPEDLVRPWLLPLVYERLVHGRGEFLSELRAAYPMFVRFGGIDYDDDPDASAKLDDFVRRAQAVLSSYDGTLLQIILGDKGAYLCAVFGTPRAHEDDASRAGAAALDLLALEGETAAGGLQIGIAYGRLRSGAYGHPMRRTFTCLGDAVNLSARLMSAAPTGEAYMTEEVRAASAGRLECELVGDVILKGKAEAARVLRLVALRRLTSTRELRYPLPMVGRDAELATIATSRRVALSGLGQVIGLAAEAGRGKSRLIAQAVRELPADQFTVAWGEAQSFGRTTSYLAWREVWRTMFGLDDDMDERVQRRVVSRHLASISPSHARRAPLLSAVLGIDIADNDLTEAFDAKLRKNSREALLVDSLRFRAGAGAVFIVLEDCHWIDPLSRDLLEALVRAAASLPVMFLLAYRPGEGPGGGLEIEQLPYFRELVLDELDASAARLVVRAKVEQVFGTSVTAAPELFDLVIERAQGNPFYLEELINYLHGLGIDPSDVNAVRRLEVPDSLQRLVLSRIDLLPEAPRSTLKVASVIGRTFETPFVQGTYPELGTLDDVEQRLGVARQADLVTIDRVEDQSWLFRHVVTREVAYESQPYAMRSLLHERVGVYLESRGQEAIERDLDLLAYHYWRSQDVGKKREYAVRAGMAAQARYANDAAADYYRSALALLADDERALVLRRLGKVLELRGKWTEAESTYDDAVELCRRLDDAVGEAEARTDLAEALRKQGRFDEARQQLALARDPFVRLDDEAGLGLVLHLEGTLASQQGRYDDARAAYEASLAIRERLGDRAKVGSLLSNLAIVAENEGDIDQAREMNERALVVREAIGDRWAICVSQNNLGMVALLQRDFGAAQRRFDEAMRLAIEVGDLWIVAVVHHNLGNAWLGLGQLGFAGAEFAQAYQSYDDFDDRWSLALLVEDVVLLAVAEADAIGALELLGAADALRGRLDAPRSPAAAEALRRALESVPPTNDQKAARPRGAQLDSEGVGRLIRRVSRMP